MTAPAWFVVYTHTHHEEMAAAHLTRQGYRVFLPRYSKLWRHARQRKRVARALFPRYLFVGLNLAVDGWRPIRSAVGVADIVRCGNDPVPVAPGVVGTLLGWRGESGRSMLKRRPIRLGTPFRMVEVRFARLVGSFALSKSVSSPVSHRSISSQNRLCGASL